MGGVELDLTRRRRAGGDEGRQGTATVTKRHTGNTKLVAIQRDGVGGDVGKLLNAQRPSLVHSDVSRAKRRPAAGGRTDEIHTLALDTAMNHSATRVVIGAAGKN